YEALSWADFKAWLNRAGEVLVLAVVVGSLALVALLDLRQQWFAFLPGLNTHYGVYCAGLLSVSFGALTAYAFGFPGLIQAVCSWAPLRWLGNMSYSYYLIHGLTLKAVSLVLFRFFAPSGHSPILFSCMFGVGLLATLLSSTALFVLVEKPLSLSSGRKKAVTGGVDVTENGRHVGAPADRVLPGAHTPPAEAASGQPAA